ncbi:MAG: ABC transporter permease [Actinomycetota bacterium]|nr:ABC transporter permease [Actinomycetota bacterium]
MGAFEALADVFSSSTVYESAFRLGVLLAFAAVGEWIAERSGTLNISVEAMLLAGTFAAIMGYQLGDSATVGVVSGAAAGFSVAWVHANLSHRLTANQFVVGLTLNVLVIGLTAFLDAELGPGPGRASVVEIPVLSDIPGVGRALFAQAWPAYLIYAVVPLAWYAMFRTRWGLEVRSMGENPQAADVTGLDVNKRRREALYVCGILCGLGGAYFVLGQVGSFQTNMTNGRGFLAIAAVIFGGWTLRGTLAGCLVFGTADAMRLALPNLGYEVNGSLLAVLPYVLALLTMLLFAHRTREPAALAQPFVRGLR